MNLASWDTIKLREIMRFVFPMSDPFSTERQLFHENFHCWRTNRISFYPGGVKFQNIPGAQELTEFVDDSSRGFHFLV